MAESGLGTESDSATAVVIVVVIVVVIDGEMDSVPDLDFQCWS